MSLISVSLVFGALMLAAGLIFIVTSVRRYGHPEVGTETAKAEFVMVGVGTFCLGLLVFLLGLLASIAGEM